MIETYTTLSNLCCKFYDLTVQPKETAQFIHKLIKPFAPKDILFVGGIFHVAQELNNIGYNLTVVDYTDEMINEGRSRLKNIHIEKGDVRSLNYKNKFDCALIIGRVFTHMLTKNDINNAFKSVQNSLKSDGICFIDNYEDSKIQKTDYFNSKISVHNENISIIRSSSTELISASPFLVNWRSSYEVTQDGISKQYTDEMQHRAFSRSEFKQIMEESGFCVHEQGNNFDETSFFTIGTKKQGYEQK